MRGYLRLRAQLPSSARVQLGGGPEGLPEREHEVLREGLGEVDEVSVLRDCCGSLRFGPDAAIVVVAAAVACECEAAGQQLAHDGVVNDEREQ